MSEAVEHLSPNHCPGQKCPPGQSSFCPWPRNEPTRCIPCVEGTFSTHASRRKACRPCSRCRDNEYEVSSCTRTSNVVCKKCSECPPGLEVVKPCTRTRDTVCRKCRLPVEFGDAFATGCNKGVLQVTDGTRNHKDFFTSLHHRQYISVNR